MTKTRRAAAWGPLMDARTRKAAGCFVLLAYIALYAVLAASLGVWLASFLPTWAQLVFYAIAGIVWIFPLKPLFGWMNRGT
jgi:membrane protein implicated in regulation of membrane protease activity